LYKLPCAQASASSILSYPEIFYHNHQLSIRTDKFNEKEDGYLSFAMSNLMLSKRR